MVAILNNMAAFYRYVLLAIRRSGLQHFRRYAAPTVDDEIILYQNKRKKPILFILIGSMSILQLGFWGYLAQFVYREFKDERLQEKVREHGSSLPTSKVLGSNKWRTFISLFALSAGLFFAYTANMFTFRTVTQLSILKQSSNVKMTTFTPWGRTRVVMATLSDLRCASNRFSAQGQLAVKAKGRPLYFLLDTKGDFLEPKLFDTLIVSRS